MESQLFGGSSLDLLRLFDGRFASGRNAAPTVVELQPVVVHNSQYNNEYKGKP